MITVVCGTPPVAARSVVEATQMLATGLARPLAQPKAPPPLSTVVVLMDDYGRTGRAPSLTSTSDTQTRIKSNYYTYNRTSAAGLKAEWNG